MSNLPPLLSELEFGAFLVYLPGRRAKSEVAKIAQEVVVGWVKQCRPDGIQAVMDRLVEEFPKSGLSDFLGPDVTLVPTPTSAPLYPNGLWPARHLCDELVRRGFGRLVMPCVRRVTAVAKSAFASPGNRPTVATHLATMESKGLWAGEGRVTIVDDVVTKGATLLATASHACVSYPTSEIRAFAIARTVGFRDDISSVVEPCKGRIWTVGSSVEREP